MGRRNHPARSDLSTLPTPALLRRIHREDRRVLPAVRRVLPEIARAVEIVVEALRSGGRLIYVGAGTSGRIALLDALEIPPTFGLSPEAVLAVLPRGSSATIESTSALEDDTALGRAEMRRRNVGRRDVVVGIAASGSTPFTLAALAEARRRGARTIALTSTPDSPLARRAELAIVPAVSEEVIRGSTRMKAGTAQKLILNMLSTAAMVRLGHVYGDLMVGVRPLNEKLRRRATSIVASAAGTSTASAARALRAAGGDVKVAVVMLQAGVTAAAARRRLAVAGGMVGEALRETEQRRRRALPPES
ncbi:MAG TPA: N-acetylmuramic acid 6-phosphate etherase [bacterium]|nr:N-acetylmuramic acid 6-phosphate etherase [bacterium]